MTLDDPDCHEFFVPKTPVFGKKPFIFGVFYRFSCKNPRTVL